MSNIFIWYAASESDYAQSLRDKFKAYGHDVTTADLATISNIAGLSYYAEFTVFIPSVTTSVDVISRIIEFKPTGFAVIWPTHVHTVNTAILYQNFMRSHDIETIVNNILLAISVYAQNRENIKRKVEKIENKAPGFIDPAIKSLQEREKENKQRGGLCYLTGGTALIVACVAAWEVGLESPPTLEHGLAVYIGTVVLKAFHGLIIIALLVAISKYMFNLGKAYMTEALRNADRIHAISFGKFYLEVYGAEAKGEEIRQVFETWNIDNNATFAKMDSNDYDPKLFDKAMELLGKATELVKASADKDDGKKD